VDADADMVCVVVVRVGVEVQVRAPPRCHNCFANTVLHEIVVEIRTGSQAQNQVRYLRFGIFGNEPDIAETVIPMITADVLSKLEWVARESGEYGTYTF
jgi:hypothetical protein